MGKPVMCVSEAEAARHLLSLLARVRAGAEVVIERNAEAVAVLQRGSAECTVAV
jgi:antitoxin (DNA-binding transcriptional repressor) of toxin-antitoxin stability system